MLGLCMCFLEYVCVCVWALLCLQDAQRRTGSLKSFGYKVKRARREMETKRREQERERDRRERKEQDTTTYTKGGQTQQSVANSHFIFVMLTVPSSYPLSGGVNRGEGEKVFTLTHTFHRTPPHPFSKQHLRGEQFFSWVPPLSQLLSPFKVQANKASSPSSSPSFAHFSFLCNYFTFKSIILLHGRVKRQASHGHDFLLQAQRNSTDLWAVSAHTQARCITREFHQTLHVLTWEKINVIWFFFFWGGRNNLKILIQRKDLMKKKRNKKNLLICFHDLAEKKKCSHIKHLTFGANFIQMPDEGARKKKWWHII